MKLDATAVVSIGLVETANLVLESGGSKGAFFVKPRIFAFDSILF
jgi:hypothetical protein